MQSSITPIVNSVLLTDTEIAEAIAHEDEAVFEKLFKYGYAPLCSYGAYLLKNNEDAEEIVQ
jgi:DNA-directed RNA polymerase specialized sigma24 family protein